MVKYRFFNKLPKILHIQKNLIFQVSINQLHLLYKFHGSGMRRTPFFQFCHFVFNAPSLKLSSNGSQNTVLGCFVYITHIHHLPSTWYFLRRKKCMFCLSWFACEPPCYSVVLTRTQILKVWCKAYTDLSTTYFMMKSWCRP